MHKHHRALGLATALDRHPGGADIAKQRPVQPVTLLRPHAARRAARFFVEKFPGRSLYAVKANPSPDLLRILWDAGVTHYDVASIGEVRLVPRPCPKRCCASCTRSRPRKPSPRPISSMTCGPSASIRMEELDKIVRATSTDGVAATDLNLLVRIRVSSDHAKLSLAAKFGAEPHEVKALLMAARQASDALGICFHVGSQAMSPAAYAEAMAGFATRSSKRRSRSTSSMSAAVSPRPIRAWSRRRSRAISRSSTRPSKRCRSATRPNCGASPAARSAPNMRSVLVRVEKRRGDELYINDGAYGALFDAAHIGWRYPVRLIRDTGSHVRADGLQLLRADLRRSRPYGRAVRPAR